MEDLSTLSEAQLDAELALYRAAGDIEVTAEADLTSVEAKVAELTTLRANHGIAYRLTQEDLEANPSITQNGFTVDEVVLLTETELTELEANKANAAALAAQKAGDACPLPDGSAGVLVDVAGVLTCQAVDPAADQKPPVQANQDATPISEGATSAPAASDGAPSEMVFMGRTVLDVRTKLINGKSYKEVDISGETHTLTPEEFDEQVRPRPESA